MFSSGCDRASWQSGMSCCECSGASSQEQAEKQMAEEAARMETEAAMPSSIVFVTLFSFPLFGSLEPGGFCA